MERPREISSVLDMIASLFMLVASVVVVWFLLSNRNTAASAGGRGGAIDNVEEMHLSVSVAEAPKMGNQNAPVAMVEFSDFECPFCKRYAQETFSSIRRDFIDTGKVGYAYIHMPLTNIHQRAFDAAGAAECAGDQGHFWEMHSLLFGQAPQGLTRDSFLKDAQDLGLDTTLFDSCARDVSPRIQRDIDEARRLSVSSTPTFLLGTLARDGTVQILRRINGAVPVDMFTSTITELLKAVDARVD